ncbi:MAG TPA: SDR family oxidoreductase [Jatrophihabitans sp.]|jgi:NAD(P)-dependent dehydrogenase (short-subunit alcohol dehydrogenase family)|uniref:SDR family oxidoreductase n=1 Tax=Jatrophihabitans sp. TaxID=1932789 RepID=UPI002E0BA1A9|nr:SDR family oxidoreductase [Jatrophihabitans sp.]
MDIKDSVAVVTGGASGIGAALARRFAADGARNVVVVDRDLAKAQSVADEVGGVAECIDVTDAAAVNGLVERTIARDGAIDLFCSNAGITTGVALDDPDDLWHRAFEVNTMAHVYAARAVLPAMLERGRGYLLQTASAAGLLTSPGDAPYAVTKHGAVAFAEWLSVTYGAQGIGVSVLCPMGVSTPLLMDPLAAGEPGAQAVAASGEILTAEQVADTVAAGLAEERFLILPHPQVGTFWAQKASDPDRWLAGVRRLVNR